MTAVEAEPLDFQEQEEVAATEKAPEKSPRANGGTETSPKASAASPKSEPAKVPEKPKESEEQDEDFSKDTPDKLIEPEFLQFHAGDMNFSAKINQAGNEFNSLSSDGYGQLFGCARANVGYKSGRYYYELRMEEMPKHVRVGFATRNSNGYLDDKESVCFDSNGEALLGGEKKQKLGARFNKTAVVGLLLNLNDFTLSLYLNGKRLREPIALPESLVEEEHGEKKLKEGGELFPAVATKGTGVIFNFSASVWKAPNFSVRTIGNAKREDIVINDKFNSQPKKWSQLAKPCADQVLLSAIRNQTVEVVIPVSFDPSKLIENLTAHNQFHVLTHATLSSWAEHSGLRCSGHQQGRGGKWQVACLDQPTSTFPLLLKPRQRYIMSLKDDFNLFVNDRADIIMKLRHGSNCRITAVIDADSIKQFVSTLDDESGNAAQKTVNFLRDHYERISLPDKEKENFDEVVCFSEGKTSESARPEVQQALDAWRRDCKLKSKVNGLKKSKFFSDNMYKMMQAKLLMQKSTAQPQRQKLLRQEKDKRVRARAEEKKRVAEEKAAALKKAEEEKAAAKAAAKEAGADDAAPEDAEEEKKEIAEEDKKETAAEEKEEEEAPIEVTEEEMNFPEVMEEFAEEDWMLAWLRAELHTVMTAFKVDVDDVERPAFPAVHFAHYYQIYTGRALAVCLQMHGCRSLEELTRLVPEVCEHTAGKDEFELRNGSTTLITDYDLIKPKQAVDVDPRVFIEMTEEARQIRTDRLDAGDENAALNFTASKNQQMQQQRAQSNSGQKRPAEQYHSASNKRQRTQQPAAYGNGHRR